ncbi:hypothetical protein EYZ11_009915 [Aspergillus tanneri]|uniref:Rhodopsin domain-containing protein n=1 Tax=Aspergillus tanneri TaxID=1220188 RepID=A0A4S3J8U4_9EURO|nr:uncharacterized protein ATNIH1004_011352 [Aspergillus tanneri]KAA8642408.1 hypothetical protein ATNIH1004_011352 [Aspergillus tanneri]THC90617.1 hypothetical protein EYZ11_009915 [Aspergillus tanneri]
MDIHADRGPVLIGSVFPVATVATLAVVGRLISRRIKNQPWRMDDYMVIVGLVLTWGCAVCATLCVQYGIGKHLETINTTFPYVKFWKTLYAFNQVYVATGPTIKISLLLLYRRIFDTALFRLVVFWLVCVNIAWYLAMSLSGVFTCLPVKGYWITDLPGRKCMSLLNYDIGYAVVNIVLDVFILILPVHMIWRLTLTASQKIALTFIFLLGSFACVTALMRLLVSILHVNDPDLTWVYLDALIWTVVEPSVAVICACLPTLRPVLSYLLPRKFSLSTASRKSKTAYGASGYPKGSTTHSTDPQLLARLDDSGSMKALNQTTVQGGTGGDDHDSEGGMEGITVRHSIELREYR